MATAVKDRKAMCWTVASSVCVCVSLLITCCYQRLVTQLRVCIFPADWPQSASPLPAPWLAAQTEAPAHKHNKDSRGTKGQKYILAQKKYGLRLANMKNMKSIWEGKVNSWQPAPCHCGSSLCIG